MRVLLLFLSVFLLFVWLGIKIHADPGYVLFAYHQWTIEMPLWFAIASIIVGFLIFYFLLRLLNRLGSMATRWRLWAKQRRLRRAHERTARGLIELAEGRWGAAEKDLLKAVNNSDAPLINYLAAARAAQEQGHYERRDDYLHQAHLATPSAEIAVGLTQAQLQLQHQQLELALATLRRLKDLAPKHAYVLKLLQKLYLRLQDFESLELLLPDLKKNKVIDATEYAALESQVYLGLLTRAEKNNNAAQIAAIWHRVPRDLARNPAILSKYVRFLLADHQSALAENLLREALKRQWNDQLVELYGLSEGEDAAKQLATAEAWLKLHPEDPALLLCLGRICARDQLWGKAKNYFENCLSLAPSARAYSALAQLLEKMGDLSQANYCYRKGLLLSLKEGQ